MQLQRLTAKRIEIILRNFSSLEKDNELRLERVEKNLERCRKNGELISKEEAILAASMSAISTAEKVDSSGDIFHDELFRTLEQSKRLYKSAFQSVLDEQNYLLAEQAEFSVLRKCITTVSEDSMPYITEFYMKNLTPADVENTFQVSVSHIYKKGREALAELATAYNEAIAEENRNLAQQETIAS